MRTTGEARHGALIGGPVEAAEVTDSVEVT